MDTFRCPICRKRVEETSKLFPFCSERCRLVDLGKWLREDYRITRPVGQAAPAEEDGEPDESSPGEGDEHAE